MVKYPNILYPFAALILFLFACQSSETGPSKKSQKGDLADFNLNGSVRSLHIMEFEVADSAGALQVLDTVGNRRMVFDSAGLITEAVFLNAEGEARMRMVYRYDSEGFKFEEVSERMLWEGEYDEKERTVYEKGDNGKKSSFKQFVDVRPLEIENRLRLSASYAYDSLDRLVEERVFRGDGVLIGKTEERYEPNGHRISVESRYSGGRVVEMIERAYDDKDHFLRYTQFDSAGRQMDYDQYTWNDEGRIVERISERDSEWRRIGFSDDERGETIERLDFDSLGTQLERTTYNRQYDDQGNLIRTERQVDGVVIGIETREISYY